MTTQVKLTAADMGCWFDGSRGIYIGEAVIACAQEYGWKPEDEWSPVDMTVDGEYYHEATDAAIEYLDSLAPEGYWFGFHPDLGDCGLYTCDLYSIVVGEGEDWTPIFWMEDGKSEPATFDELYFAERVARQLESESRIAAGWHIRHAVTGERAD